MLIIYWVWKKISLFYCKNDSSKMTSMISQIDDIIYSYVSPLYTFIYECNIIESFSHQNGMICIYIYSWVCMYHWRITIYIFCRWIFYHIFFLGMYLWYCIIYLYCQVLNSEIKPLGFYWVSCLIIFAFNKTSRLT